MKRFISVLSSLLVLPAFAEVAPLYYDEVVEYTDEMINAEDEANSEASADQKQNVAQRTTINRSTSATRAVAAGTNASSRANTSSRAVASSPRTTTAASRATTARTTKAQNVTSRSASRATTARATTSRNTQSTKPVTARVSTQNNSVMPANRSYTYGTNSVLTDSGQSLYNSNTSRVGAANRRSNARISTAALPTTKTTTITQEDVTSTTSNLTALAELTDYCKAQYAACMDNYCNVLDDNQGRCSCSKNLKNYEKTEAALAQATEDFQEVVQKIKYIGLTGPQIESLFAETEAELSMKSNSDSSRLKNSLDAIKKKVVDVSSPTATSSSLTSGLSLDLNGLLSADFTSGFDLNSFLGTTGTNTNSVSNQRGEQLYKTAANRCKTAVLNSCTAQGIDANVITNSYDLEIDKQCIAYERSLNEANTEMKNNVTNATNILQQARLLLTQNKNSYDFRGCVAAIDSCMQDEYVCGSDYELCLDPTGKYLANGEIVKGSTPGASGGQAKNEDELTENNMDTWISEGMYNLYATWNYEDKDGEKNAWSVSKKENLGEYVDYYLADWKSNYNKTTSTDVLATYLLQKVGYIDKDDKVHGMCASVMKQCQDYTYDNSKGNNKKYLPGNDVVRQYLNSVLPKIKVQQDAILTDYAEGCRSDVESCLSTNGYEESNTKSTASKTAVNACSSEIATCMSVGGYQVKDGVKLTLRAMTDWVDSILKSCPTNTYLVDAEGIDVTCAACDSVPVYTAAGPKQCNVCTEDNCKPAADDYVCIDNVAYDNATDRNRVYGYLYTQTVSAGGRVTSCSCQSGYTDEFDSTGKLVRCISGVEQ